MSFKLNLQIGIVSKLQQHVNHILRYVILNTFPSLVVFVQYMLQKHIKFLCQNLHPLHIPLQIQEFQPWNRIPDVRNSVQQEQLVQHLLELLRRHDRALHFLVEVVFPENHPADHVQADGGEFVFEIHRRFRSRLVVDGGEEGFGFFHADVFVGFEASGAEKLHQAHLPGLPPVGAVGGPGDVGVVVGRVFSGGGFGAVGEGDVVGFEDELGGGDGGGDDDGGGAEAEVDEGAVLLGEGVEGVVGEGADEVEVSDNRPWLWAWREVEFAAAVEVEVGGEEEERRRCQPCSNVGGPSSEFHFRRGEVVGFRWVEVEVVVVAVMVVVELRALAKGFIDEPKFGSGNFYFFFICIICFLVFFEGQKLVSYTMISHELSKISL